jgi:hypothetical protein
MREQLERACEKSGSTMSREIETRLRLSFEIREKEKEKFGGPTNYWLLRLIANQIKTVERFAGNKRWWEDAYTFNQVMLLIGTIFEFFKPEGEEVIPASLAQIGEPLGQHMAKREIANIQAAALDPDPPLHWNWGGMTVAEWSAAALPLAGKLKRSPLRMLYGKGEGK